MACETVPTIYFAYGSNLWQDNMKQRCPTSKYLGVARLDGYHRFVNKRGSANIVEDQSIRGKSPLSPVVYGLAYAIHPDDEAALDAVEEVPNVYTKEFVLGWIWPRDEHGATSITASPAPRKMLVYIDRDNLQPVCPLEQEHVRSINMGIADLSKDGVPKAYIEAVIRRFIPSGDGTGTYMSHL